MGPDVEQHYKNVLQKGVGTIVSCQTILNYTKNLSKRVRDEPLIFFEARDNGISHPYRKTFVTKQGTDVPTLTQLILLDRDRDEFAAVVLELTEGREDLMAECRFEREKIKAGDRLQEYLSTPFLMDLSNLLCVLTGYADLASFSKGTDEIVADCLQEITVAADRMAQLVTSACAFAYGRRRRTERLSVSEEVRHLAHLIRCVARGKPVELELDDNVGVIEAEAGAVQQLLLNLVVHGLEAIGENPGLVRITTGNQNVEADHIQKCAWKPEQARPGSYVFVEVFHSGSGTDGAAIATMVQSPSGTKPDQVFWLVVGGLPPPTTGSFTLTAHLARGAGFECSFQLRPGHQNRQSRSKVAYLSSSGSSLCLLLITMRESGKR